MKILGIETSCDETAAAVVEDGVKVLSNVVASSQELHKKTGGIVPEVAAREQICCIIPVIEEALKQANLDSMRLDAIAVTIGGPGLIGSLIVGVETARVLSHVWSKPLVPVIHLYGHIYANWLERGKPNLPAVVLTVAGGHSDLFYITQKERLVWLGGTRDDSAGEAFDKVAKLLGLPYPGGPAIEKMATEGDASAFNFPKPLIGSGDYDFSFSGLKTSVLKKFNELKLELQVEKLPSQTIKDLAASFQQAVNEILIVKTLRAADNKDIRTILLAGGVAANLNLRKMFEEKTDKELVAPPIKFCTDNAACIAAYAHYHFKPVDWRKVKAEPNVEVFERVRR